MTSNVQVTIAPKGTDLDVTIDLRNSEPDLAQEELETLTQRLFQQLGRLDEVEQVNRIPEPTPPEASKPLSAAFLIGLLTAEVNAKISRHCWIFCGNACLESRLS